MRPTRCYCSSICCTLAILLAASQYLHTCSASTVSDCETVLSQLVTYDVANDIAEQRQALIEFYNSTAGAHWSVETLPLASITEIQSFEAYLLQLSQYSASPSFNVSQLSTQVQQLYEVFTELSVNCTLQHQLQLVNLLIKYPWNTAGVSYCNWYGVACCQTAGDFFSQYCSQGAQSVAQIFLTDANLSGTVPSDLGRVLVDLQMFNVRDNPGLTGRFPDVAELVAAKMQVFNVQNTSLVQCDAHHIDALATDAYGTNYTVDGHTSAAGNTTGCLPNFLRFCPAATVASTGQACPFIAYDRPADVYPTIESQASALLAEFSTVLSALLGGVTTDLNAFAGLNYTSNFSCPTDGTAGGIKGPSIGQLTATVSMDASFYSWVGCNCSDGNDDREYTISSSGNVSMTCTPSQESPRSPLNLAAILPPTIAGFLLGLIALIIALLYWRRMIADVATYKQNWNKRRSPPGTLKEGLAEQLGLIPKEVTIVMTDVQGSSRLWEWNQVVMTSALAMHDHLLRLLLHQHCGYEVATEGDAFTMAFHDPIDAIAWALNVQHRLLTLPWPPELLLHPECSKLESPNDPNQLLFQGLRVRMGIHTAKPDSVQVHHVTRQIEYHGELMSLAETIVGFPVGGQILISGWTYQRIYGRLHTIGALAPVKTEHKLRGASLMRGNSKLASWAKTGSLQSQPDSAKPMLSVTVPSDSPAGAFAPGPRGETLTPRGDPSTTNEASKGELPDGLNRMGSFTAEQLAAFGFQQGTKLGAIKTLKAISVDGGRGRNFWGRLLPRRRRSHPGQHGNNRVWERRWAPSQTHADTMVRSSAPTSQPASCMVVDMGAFNLIEFVKTIGEPQPGLSVIGGVHMLQILSHSLAGRATAFAPLDATNKVAPTFFDAPGARAAVFTEDALVPADKPYITMVFCGPADYKALFALDAQSAQEAMLQFQSCVRSTLELADGYECQEKDGLFMIAFDKPWAAVEWAVTLQLAMLRVEWSPLLELYEVTAEVKGSQGQTLMKGLSAKVGIFPGHMAKICPHTSTGRADYFGPAVNRAARLLIAAKGGQILVEETFMRHVVRHWQGSLSEMDSSAAMQMDAAMEQAAVATESRRASMDTPRPTNRLSQAFRQDQQPGSGAAKDDKAASSWTSALYSRQTPSAAAEEGLVSLSEGQPTSGPTQPGKDNGSASDADTFLTPELRQVPANQPSHAASTRMAVNNCHMLQYRAEHLGQSEQSPTVSQPILAVPAPGALQSGASRASMTLQTSSLLQQKSQKFGGLLQSKVHPSALVTISHGGKRRASLVWNEAFSSGKDFPTCKVPIEVWSLGRFKFKGIAGTCKVMQVYPTELVGRLQLQDYQLHAGKATLVSQATASCQYKTDISLLDVFKLKMSTT